MTTIFMAPIVIASGILFMDPVIVHAYTINAIGVIALVVLMSLAISSAVTMFLGIKDVAADYAPEMTFQYLAVENIECDISLEYKQYKAWAADPIVKEKVDLIVKEWLTVEV